MMRDGISFGEKHSFRDFGLTIASRNIAIPEKRLIKVTIPYMHGAYDYSALNGFPSYDERKITYAFDVIGSTVVEMEQEKAAVMAWLLTAQDVDIFDDAYPDTHFHGSYDSATWDEDDSQGLLTVVFSVYPFRLANEQSVLEFTTAEATKNAFNDGVPVNAKIISPQGATIKFGGGNYAIGSGGFDVLLSNGDNPITVQQEQLLPYSGYEDSHTDAGIVYTVDKVNGTVVASGISTAISWFEFGSFKLKVGRYRCSGAPYGNAHNRIQYTVTSAVGERYVVSDIGAGCVLDITDGDATVLAAIRIGTGKEATSQVYAPRVYQVTTMQWRTEVI